MARSQTSGSVRSCDCRRVVAGFGIKDAASAAAMARQADGVVVGSALVAVLAEAGSAEEAAQRAGDFLAPLRQALDA